MHMSVLRRTEWVHERLTWVHLVTYLYASYMYVPCTMCLSTYPFAYAYIDMYMRVRIDVYACMHAGT